MKNLRYFLLLLTVGCGSSVFPAVVIPSRPVAADWPDAGAAIIEDVAVIKFETARINREYQPLAVAIVEHRRRLKILSNAGLAASKVELEVDAWSEIKDIHARAVYPDGTIINMSSGDIYVVPQTHLGQALPLKTITFVIPHAKVGGLIEYSYRQVYPDALFLPTWVFGSRYPVIRSELSVIYDQDMTVDFRFGKGEKREEFLPLRRNEDGRSRLVFVLQDLPPYYPESHAIHIARQAPWLALVVTSVRKPEPRRLETWDDFRQFMSILAYSLGELQASGSPRKVYRTVRDSIDTISSNNLASLKPVQITQMKKGVPVCNRDASATLLKALQANHIEVAPAYATGSTGPPVLHDFPGAYGFVRALVAVRVISSSTESARCSRSDAKVDPSCNIRDGEIALLDPGCSQCRFGEVSWELAGGEAVVIWPDKVSWIPIALDSPEQHSLRLRYHLKIDSDGTVTGNLKGSATGNAANLIMSAIKNRPDSDITNAIYGEISPHPKLSGLSAPKRNEAEQDFVFSAKVKTRIEKQSYERFVLHPAEVSGQALPGDWRITRRADAILHAPRTIEHVIVVDLPTGYDVTLPLTITIKASFAEYFATYERRDRSLVLLRRIRLKAPIIKANQWDVFKRFIDKVEEYDSQGALISVRN